MITDPNDRPSSDTVYDECPYHVADPALSEFLQDPTIWDAFITLFSDTGWPTLREFLLDAGGLFRLNHDTRTTIINLVVTKTIGLQKYRNIVFSDSPDKELDLFFETLNRPLIPLAMSQAPEPVDLRNGKPVSAIVERLVARNRELMDPGYTAEQFKAQLSILQPPTHVTRCVGKKCEHFDICEHNPPVDPDGFECPEKRKSVDMMMAVLHGSTDTASLRSIIRTEVLVRPLLYSLLAVQNQINETNAQPTYEYKDTIRANPLFQELRKSISALDGLVDSVAKDKALQELKETGNEKLDYYSLILEASK